MRPEIKEIKRARKNFDICVELNSYVSGIYGALFYSFYLILLAILAFILIIFEPGKPYNRIIRFKQFIEGFKGDKKGV